MGNNKSVLSKKQPLFVNSKVEPTPNTTPAQPTQSQPSQPATETEDPTNLINDISTINTQLNKIQTNIIQEITDHETKSYDNNNQLKLLQQNIKDKIELLSTRDRMLQLSQERNAYKKKLIFILFSIIIGLLIAIISVYYIFNKNKLNAK
jgi:peptidoglycan hydrolase CwlO-like protein